MKLSALIHSSALQFLLNKSRVKEILGPIDSNPNFTTKSIEMRILNDKNYPIILEALFIYHKLGDYIEEPPKVKIIVEWFPNLEFSLKNVKLIQNN